MGLLPRSKRHAFALFAMGVGVGAFTLSRLSHREGVSTRLFVKRSLLGLRRNIFKSDALLRSEMLGRPTPKEASVPRTLRAACRISERVIDGQSVILLEPRHTRTDRHILYLHGGGYVQPIASEQWSTVAELIRVTGASVTVPLYALAPENDHRRATALVDQLYDELVASRGGAPLFVAGDSAGGNFTARLAVRLRDAGKTVPTGIILLSPWLDLELRNEKMRDLEPREVVIGIDGARQCGRWWAGDKDPGSPEFSPLRADFAGLPPVAIFQGDHDILVLDARDFAAACEAAGVPCLYREYPGAFHGFMCSIHTPEAHDVYRRIGGFVDALTRR